MTSPVCCVLPLQVKSDVAISVYSCHGERSVVSTKHNQTFSWLMQRICNMHVRATMGKGTIIQVCNSKYLIFFDGVTELFMLDPYHSELILLSCIQSYFVISALQMVA